jgi:hypothetical protein
MRKTLCLGLIGGFITIAVVLLTTLSFTDASASKNEWGDLASDLAKEGKMGPHSSDPIQGDDDRETPRSGVGNLDLDGDGERDHPSETADTLRDLCESGQGSEDQCP